jgi:hypothetical protein
MHMLTATPVRSTDGASPENVIEQTIIGGSVVSSILVFFMWVGAWGSIDIIIQLISDNRIYQLTLYFLLFACCAVASRLLMDDWRKSQVEPDASTTV